MNPTGRGSVRIRSNVATSRSAYELIPGDLLTSTDRLPNGQKVTPKQRNENLYYQPCCKCKRTVYDIAENGCDICANNGQAISREEAKRRREVRMNRAESETAGDAIR